jgi:acetate kinase
VRVLVVNAGSSTLKLSLLDGDDRTLGERELPAARADARADSAQLAQALADGLGQADAVGHRIVHGGERFRRAVRIDDRVRDALAELVDLAPLHQPNSLAALLAVSEQMPGTPAVACFDTAFHTTLAPAAYRYALPAEWQRRWPIRRFGFHGLSHAWIARRVPQLLRRAAEPLRIVSCHLGAGASLCAIANGRSVDTTMGFTPLEGLVMATRSGSVDPGLVLWLQSHGGLGESELADALEHRSGLFGLAGSADMREVLARAAGGDDAAQLALAVYVHRLRGAIAAMAAAMDGLDAIAFTGGVGERSATVRERTAGGLGFLGVRIDAGANASAQLDADVSATGASVRALVIGAREDLEIARQVRGVLSAA